MIRYFTLLALLLSVATSFAQLPDGATAPNFVAKDINGRTWNLYDILESGRPVILDIFATWCGPCWNYHSSGALDTYYAQHGPEADAQSMVFMIEGDATTNTDCIYNLNTCNSSTQGNWALNTDYPILDNVVIANSYKTTYFPTIYRVCPDKTLIEIGQVANNVLWSSASASGCLGQVPVNYAKVLSLTPNARTLEICNPQIAKPAIQLTNLGTSHIATMDVTLSWNGNVIQTKTYTGDTKVFDNIDIQFDPITIDGAGTLTADVATVNGQSNGLTTGSKSVNFVQAPESYGTQQVVMILRNESSQAKDTYWAMYDDAGNLLYHGGNELVGENGGGQFPNGAPADPSAYANNQVVKDTMTVPAGGCFSFKLVDGRGVGLAPPANLKLFELGGALPFYGKYGNFGPVDQHTFAQKTTGTHEPVITGTLDIAPNPVSDVLNASYSVFKAGNVTMMVTNATGQTVWEQAGQYTANGNHTLNLQVHGFDNGIYFLSMQSADGIMTRRFAVTR